MASGPNAERCRVLNAAIGETGELLSAISVRAAQDVRSHPRKLCLELLEKQAERVAHESARLGVTMPMSLDARTTVVVVNGFVDAYAKLVSACQLYSRFCGPLLATQLQTAVRRVVESCGTQIAQWLVSLGGKCPPGPIQDAVVSSSKWKQASYALVQERCAAIPRLPRTDAACALRTIMQIAVILKDTLAELDEALPPRPGLGAIEALLRGEECEPEASAAAAAGAASDSDDDELDPVAAEAAHRCRLIMKGLRAWAGASVREVRSVAASAADHVAAMEDAVAAFDGQGAGSLQHTEPIIRLHVWLADVEATFGALRGPLVDLGELASSSAEDIPAIRNTCGSLMTALHACSALLLTEAIDQECGSIQPAASRHAVSSVMSDAEFHAVTIRLSASIQSCTRYCAAVLSDDFGELHELFGEGPEDSK